MLCKISDFEIEKLSLSKTKDATYLQADKQPFELQTDWLTLGKYPLPSKKFIESDTKWINITVPIKKNDDNYLFFSAIDSNLSKFKILSDNKRYHPLVFQKEKDFFLKFKLYPNTALFDKEKNRISITSLTDFHRYLGEGKIIKIVFGFSKLWTMCEQYGFSLSVKRILLKDAVNEIPEETRNAFLSDDD